MSWLTKIVVENDNWWSESPTHGLNTEEHIEQHTYAMNAVFDLIRSGAFGEPTGRFVVTICGHGNPGHQPTPGWSNDFISINIQQVSE